MDRKSPPRGQATVEFALVILVFLLVTVGLLDGLRVIFYYGQIQEAARQGARWGAVQVGRGDSTCTTPSCGSAHTIGGDFSTTGDASGTYCLSTCAYPLLTSRFVDQTNPITPTIVGATVRATSAVDLSRATISVATTITATTEEISPTDALYTDLPVTVTVSYPFQPVLGMVFGGVRIPLRGTSVMLHE